MAPEWYLLLRILGHCSVFQSGAVILSFCHPDVDEVPGNRPRYPTISRGRRLLSLITVLARHGRGASSCFPVGVGSTYGRCTVSCRVWLARTLRATRRPSDSCSAS